MKRGYSAVLLCIVLLFSCGIVSGVLSEDGDDRFVEPDLNMTGGDEPSAPPKETKLFDPEDESGPLEEDDPVEISVNMNVEGEPHIPLEELGHSEHGEDELEGLHQPEEIPDSIPFFLEEMPPFEGDPLNVYSRPLYEPDSILVQFKPPVASNTILMATTSDHLNALHQTTTRLDLADYGQPGLLVINLPDDLTVPDAINRFSRHPDILFAEPNFYYYHDKIPDDPDFGLLWGLRNTGQIVGGQAGTTGADISAPGAWDITTGSTDVVIAVIDSGIYLNHYDLNQNIWRNIKEKYSGSDTDGNGYIDDVDGWNFYNENNDVTDLNGHGTHCAGTIAAIGDNRWTIAGVMWTARIMPLKFSGPHGSGTTLGAIKAINYAKENGAHIISNSWGSAGYSEALKTAIEGFDGIVVCSAGNNASNNDILPRYPSCYNSSNIISVAATDNNDALSEFSCYGANTVHVGAPGTMIYSTSILYDYEELFSDPLTTLDNWTINPNGSWDVSSSAYRSSPGSVSYNATLYQPNTYIWLIMKDNLTLNQYRLPELSFWYNTSLTYEDSFLGVYASSPVSSTYYTIGQLPGNTNGTWEEITITPGKIHETYAIRGFTTVPEEIRFAIILRIDNVSAQKHLFFDDIRVRQVTGINQDYEYMNGTSMATPHVTGLAGLLKAYNASLQTDQIKEIIYANVDPLPSLAGRTVTGGRINASQALEAVHLKAGFESDKINGSAPLRIQFTDRSVGREYTSLWSFGDGSTSDQKNPGYTYTLPGTYTVNLTITNTYGANTTSQSNLITVQQTVDPTPTPTPTPIDPYVPPHPWVRYLGTDTVNLVWPESYHPLFNTEHDGKFNVLRFSNERLDKVWEGVGSHILDQDVPENVIYHIIPINKTTHNAADPEYNVKIELTLGLAVGGEFFSATTFSDTWDAKGGTVTLFKDTILSEGLDQLSIVNTTIIAAGGKKISGYSPLTLQNVNLEGVSIDLERGDSRSLQIIHTARTTSPIKVRDNGLNLESIDSTSSIELIGDTNTISSIRGSHISMTGEGARISNTTINGTNDGKPGILLQKGNNSIIRDNIIEMTGSGKGIHIQECYQNITVWGNSISNVEDGIYAIHPWPSVPATLDGYTIRQNTISNVGRRGIHLGGNHGYGSARYAEILENTANGMVWFSGDSSRIERNNLNASINAVGSHNYINRNNVTDTDFGIFGDGDEILIAENQITNFSGADSTNVWAVTLTGQHGIIRNNTISNFRQGISIAGEHQVIGNTIDNTANMGADTNNRKYLKVILASIADGSVIERNVIRRTNHPHTNHGIIHIGNSGNLSVRENLIDGGDSAFAISIWSPGEGIIIENNTINNMSREYSNTGGIHAQQALSDGELRIVNNSIRGGYGLWGIHLDRQNKAIVINNTIAECGTGIIVISSNNTFIADNSLWNMSRGIYLPYPYSFETTISGNSLEVQREGMVLYAQDAAIDNNTITITGTDEFQPHTAIWLLDGDQFIIHKNTIRNRASNIPVDFEIEIPSKQLPGALILCENTIERVSGGTTFSASDITDQVRIRGVNSPPEPLSGKLDIGQWLNIQSLNFTNQDNIQLNLTFHYKPEDFDGVGGSSMSVWRYNNSKWDGGYGEDSWSGERWLDTTKHEVGVAINHIPPYEGGFVIYAPLKEDLLAEFDAEPTSGAIPLLVQFTDLSEGEPTSWRWTFGDGSGSATQHSSHIYEIPGTYTVTLEVERGDEKSLKVKKEYIRVTIPLQAGFHADRTAGFPPLDVRFTDLSEGEPAGWLWQFGDENRSSVRNPLHTYTVPGTYTVNLTVWNEDNRDTISRRDYIEIYGSPGVTGITPTFGYRNGLSIQARISGDGFRDGALARLVGPGDGVIDGTALTVAGLNQITCTFNLTEALPGAWTVLVENADGKTGLLQGGFTIRPRGDFNGNARVDIGDVARVAWMAVGLTPDDPEARFGGGDTVTGADAARIAYYYVGKTQEI